MMRKASAIIIIMAKRLNEPRSSFYALRAFFLMRQSEASMSAEASSVDH